MTTEPIPNPPAFPRPSGQGGMTSNSGQPGMSLRDHFAGQALAMLADPSVLGPPKTVAIAAYGYADAMLAERIKPVAESAPDAVTTYTEARRIAAVRAVAHADFVAVKPGNYEALVDLVAEALGMRKAGA